MKKNIPNTNECSHDCTSNCRREGCNCECGEYHEKFDCEICLDTGEVSYDEQDADGNWQRGVGTRKCECQIVEPADFTGATPGDR